MQSELTLPINRKMIRGPSFCVSIRSIEMHMLVTEWIGLAR
jgi:hypothetical protein